MGQEEQYRPRFLYYFDNYTVTKFMLSVGSVTQAGHRSSSSSEESSSIVSWKYKENTNDMKLEIRPT